MIVGVTRPHQSRICFRSEAIDAAFGNHLLELFGPVGQEIYAELRLPSQFFCKQVFGRVFITPSDLPL